MVLIELWEIKGRPLTDVVIDDGDVGGWKSLHSRWQAFRGEVYNKWFVRLNVPVAAHPPKLDKDISALIPKSASTYDRLLSKV